MVAVPGEGRKNKNYSSVEVLKEILVEVVR